jgi:hypothetical protein
MNDTDILFLLAEDKEDTVEEEELEKLQAIVSANVILHGMLEVAQLRIELRCPN